jgi:hypothetical protein
MASIEIDNGKVVVIYNRRSGAVIHVHEEIVLEGGHSSSEEEFVQKALTLARSFAQKEIKEASTLVINSEELPGDGRFRVDVRRKQLMTKQVSVKKQRRAASQRPIRRNAGGRVRKSR